MEISAVDGEPLKNFRLNSPTLISVLKQAADLFPEHGVSTIEGDRLEFQSYAGLQEQAKTILGGFRDGGVKPGEKILLALTSARDFLPVFWACVLGGIVPVPVSVSMGQLLSRGFVERFAAVYTLLDTPLVVTSNDLIKVIRSQVERAKLGPVQITTASYLSEFPAVEAVHHCSDEDLALLLMTSGSTGIPKLVELTHRNLICMAAGTAQMNGFDSDEITLNWLPLDHVGAISFLHIMPMVLGCHQIHADTSTIMRSPLTWLDLIDQHRATISWAPNFAFRLIKDLAAELPAHQWDLSCMRFMVNAGEAVVASTSLEFCGLLAPFGFRRQAIRPAFGMSECASGITWSDGSWLTPTRDTEQYVEVGRPIPGASIRIVDDQDSPVAEGKIGRLQLTGPTVTRGYFANEESTRQSFTTDGWFRTGDLGFIRGSLLYITGREKEILIVNGVHYLTNAIESAIEELPAVTPSYTAVCAFRPDDSDTDQMAVFFSPQVEDSASIRKQIRGLILQRFGLRTDHVFALSPDDIPKSTIGKIRKSELITSLAGGNL